MKDTEIVKLLMIVQASYPNYHLENKELTVNVWKEMLKDYTYEQCALGLKTFIMKDKSGFAPSIGQLIDSMHVVEDTAYPSEQEAWSMVAKACSNGNYGYNEEFAKLPPLIQKAVGSPMNIHEWASVPIDEFQTVIQSNFMRSYRATVNGDKEFRRYPEGVKQLIANTSNLMLSGE